MTVAYEAERVIAALVVFSKIVIGFFVWIGDDEQQK
jgi:hypothetical protein